MRLVGFIAVVAVVLLIERDGTSRYVFPAPDVLRFIRQTKPADAAVEIRAHAYRPRQIEIAAGATVTWTNRDGSPHTVTASGGDAFDSGRISKDGRFTWTFTEPGRYAYECFYHQNMTGVVSVT